MKAEPLYTREQYENALKTVMGDDLKRTLEQAGIRGTSLLHTVVFDIFIKRLDRNSELEEACDIIRSIAIDLQITGIFQFKK